MRNEKKLLEMLGGAALIDHHCKVPISAAEREKMNTAEKLGREMMRGMFEKN